MHWILNNYMGISGINFSFFRSAFTSHDKLAIRDLSIIIFPNEFYFKKKKKKEIVKEKFLI